MGSVIPKDRYGSLLKGPKRLWIDMNLLWAILFALLLSGAPLRAEDAPPAETVDGSAVLSSELGTPEGASAGGDAAEERAKLLQKLSAKLLNHKGQPVSVAVFSPTDFTTSQVGNVVSNTLVTSLKKYGNLNVHQEKYQLENLTLGEFRKGMAQFKVDVLVATSLRNTTFDLYIYDRRTPYYIYAHSEPIPEAMQLQITPEIATQYARVVLRRAIYRYINDQYFELPRQDSAPVLQSEIPRWIASPESLAQINREMISNYYFGISSGAAFAHSAGSGAGHFWNSSILALQFGHRIYGNLFAELGIENSAYNNFIGTFKYVFANREHPYRFAVGVGASYLTAFKVLDVDSNGTFGTGALLMHASFSFLFPIGDVYLKLENRNFVSIGSPMKLMFTLMPGILIHF